MLESIQAVLLILGGGVIIFAVIEIPYWLSCRPKKGNNND